MLNCLIVDDEPLARQQIARYVEQVPYLKLVGTARNPVIAQTILGSEPIDLIFLDIKMPQMSGLDFLTQHEVFQQIIFITAYAEFAVAGFEVEATDYLTKPVSFDRFLKACEKAKIRVGGSETIKLIQGQPDYFYVKCNARFERIYLNDILYIESKLNYVLIVIPGKNYIVYSSLKALEAWLPAEKFVRTHKSYLVATAAIDIIEPHQLQIGNRILPVSRANKQKVLQIPLQNQPGRD